MKNKLFVAEYEESYTGGSVVFIGTLKRFGNMRQDLVTNQTFIDLYNFYHKVVRKNLTPNSSEGEVNNENDLIISRAKLQELCAKHLTNKKAIKIVMANAIPENGYNRKLGLHRYDTNCVDFLRPDWMYSKWQLPEGLYIVFVSDTNSKETGVVSDTYYCA